MVDAISDFPLEKIREDFPILSQSVNGCPLIYLDNGATTQLPKAVIEAICAHYQQDNANVHRGMHTLSERSTAKLESARKKVARFINAASSNEVVFTSGTTGSINLVASMLADHLGEKDSVVVTALEHHSNYVPWQQLCMRTGSEFIVCPIDDHGDIAMDQLEYIMRAHHVGLLASTHVSNVLGTVTPAKELADLAHRYDSLFLLDAAQSIRHELVDVANIGCDFMAFSGHKILAPTGIGVLYGKEELLNDLNPSAFGGEMVDTVSFKQTTFEKAPLRLEAGTPNYVGAHALGVALDYLEERGRSAVSQYEHQLLEYAEERLSELDGIQILGAPENRAGCLSFCARDAHPFDIAMLADSLGVALRSGTQCAQPLLRDFLGVDHVVRITPAFYNSTSEIDTCVDVLQKVLKMLRA